MTGRAAALALLALGACHAQPRPAAPTQAGQVRLAEGRLRGKLVVGWLTPEEAQRWERHQVQGRDIVALLTRLRVTGPLDLDARGQPFSIDAPADVRAIAVLDPGEQLLSALFRGVGTFGLAPAGGREVVLSTHPPRGAPPACEGPRLQAIVVQDPALRGSVDNPIARRFCAYLPRRYAEAPARRYPVALLLPGFGSDDLSYLWKGSPLREAADRLADETGREIILVGVDTHTRTGSTYLVDSPVTGAFDTFLSGPALATLDAQLRTIPTREARAVLGHSTGGFNAVSFGLRHLDRLAVIGASSPDGLDLDRWIFDEHRRVRPWLLAWARVEAAVGFPGQILSYAADWSPAEGGALLPFDLSTGAPTADWSRWHAASPIVMLDAMPDRAPLVDRVFVAVGDRDEFGLTEPARAFAARMAALGLRPTFEVTPQAGHFDRQFERLAHALRFALERLTPAR